MKRKFTMMILAMLLMSIGTHAATLNNPTATDIKNCTDETLIVTGTLSAEAIAALQELNSKVKNVLLNQVTDYDASADFKFTSTTVQNIVLPKDLAEVKADWFTGCSSLNCAISYSDYGSDGGKSLKVFSNKENSLKDTFTALTLNNTESDLGTWAPYNKLYLTKDETTQQNLWKIDEVIWSGALGSSDLGSAYGSSIHTEMVKHLDIQEANITSLKDVKWFSNNSAVIEQIELPKNATELLTPVNEWDNGFFTQCSKLKSVKLPEALYSIPQNTFNGCSSLESIVIPSSVTSIGSKAFNQCTNLKTIVIGKGVTTIGNSAFYDCKSIETVEFEQGVTNLNFASGVFESCVSLKHIVLPEGLQNIGDHMFSKCSNLESVRLPNSLLHIEDGAFEFCYSLTYLTIPDGVKTIGCDAFNGSGIEDVYLMATKVEGLPYICSSAFGGAPFTGNESLSIDISKFAERLKLLIKRNIVTDCTTDDVDNWMKGLKEGLPENDKHYDADHLFDKFILSHFPSDEVEQIYRELLAATGNTISMLHYPKIDEDGNDTELSNFIDGNPWKGKLTKDDLNGKYGSGFYSNGQVWNDGHMDWYRWDDELKRMNKADHLTGAYGIGPDAEGRYWPDTNHGDQVLRDKYGNPDNEINANDAWKDVATVTDSNNPFSGSYMGYSRYYWRKFLLQTGYNRNNDEVYTKLYDDTWYTMCFPFDLTDEQLEAAFQSNKFNICEFSGAITYKTTKESKTGTPVEVNNLVLCFTQIAYTWYKDKYEGYYERIKEGDNKRYFKTTRTWNQSSANGVGEWQLGARGAEVKSVGDDADIYKSIRGILAVAGHPYMIHPYRVESLDGKQTLCTIPKVVYKNGFNRRTADNYETVIKAMEKLYNDEAVTHPLYEITYDEKLFADDLDGITKNHGVTDNYGRYEKLTNKLAGTYTFKGAFLPSKDDRLSKKASVDWDKTEEVIPYRSYFLGVEAGQKYPKFWRETSENASRTKGLWKQYTAIVTPDPTAKDWEDKEMVKTTVSGGAKGVNMMFGDFDEEVTADEIEEIVAEAERKGEPVERMNIIVNINGQVMRQGTDVQGLPSGIYIVNGKKYLVK